MTINFFGCKYQSSLRNHNNQSQDFSMDITKTSMGQTVQKLIDPYDAKELLAYFKQLMGKAKIPANSEDFMKYCQYRLTRCILLEWTIAKRVMKKYPTSVPRGTAMRNLFRMYSRMTITMDIGDNRVFVGDEEEVKRRKERGYKDEDFTNVKIEFLTFYYKGKAKFTKRSKPL